MRDELLAPDFPAPETDEAPNAANDDSPVPATNPAVAGLDHWEQEKEKLTLALTERLLRGREGVAFSELKNAPIFLERGIGNVGEIVLALLRRQARQIIRQDKPLVLQSKRRFELDDNDVRGQLRRLRDLLAERLVFDKNEVQAAIAFAVRLQFDLLTKPRAALEQLIYSRSPIRPKSDVVVILVGLDAKHRLVASMQHLLAEHPDGLLTKEEFGALCRRAESGVKPIPTVIADLQAYQQFCASIGPSSSARVHRQTVLRMLHERGLHELAENALPELTQQQWWALTDIASVLERALAKPSLSVEPPEPVATPPMTEFELSRVLQDAAAQMENLLDGASRKAQEAREQQIEEAQVALNLESAGDAVLAATPIASNGKDDGETVAASDEIKVQPTAATEIVASSENMTEPDRAVEPEIPPPTESEFEEVDLQAILQVEEATLPEPPKIVYNDTAAEERQIITRASLEAQPPGPYPSITRLIDGKSRLAFIKKVFHRDLDAYLDFIEKLEATQTWKEAKALLDVTFKQRKVNPYSKEAVQMSDLVFSRYFTRGAK